MMTDTAMKISEDTLSVLKNFSTLNSNIYIKPGNKIRTITPAKNVMGEAIVSETFENEIGIFDLSKFLGTISLFTDPEFIFQEKFVLISGRGGSEVKYYYTEPSLLTHDDREIGMPDPVVNFSVSDKQLSEIQKASAVLQLPNISFEAKDGEIHMVAFEKPGHDYTGSGYDAGSNTYTVVLGNNDTGAGYEYHFNIENLRILPGSYDVSLSDNVISKMTHTSGLDLSYWIAFSPTSRYHG